jgi:hypothetical protein
MQKWMKQPLSWVANEPKSIPTMQCHLGPVKVLQKQEAPGHITFSNLLSSIIRFPISSSYVQEVTFMKRAISVDSVTSNISRALAKCFLLHGLKHVHVANNGFCLLTWLNDVHTWDVIQA